MTYHPDRAPDASAWLASDESERIAAVLVHHAGSRSTLPNERLHAAIHVVVENQIAEGLPAAVRTMKRFREGGAMRHEAIHAIASVVAASLSALLDRKADGFDPVAYATALDQLVVDEWVRPAPE